MGVNRIQGMGLNKAGKVAGVVGALAAAGSLAYAAKTGKVEDTFEGSDVQKGVAKVGDGYKQLGNKIVDTTKSLYSKAKDKITDMTSNNKKTEEK